MTIADLESRANADAGQADDARRMMAGKYGIKAVRALRSHDWEGATEYLIRAAQRAPAYAEALPLIDAARRGSIASPAKAAASRANGAKGGRPKISAGKSRNT